MKATLSLAQMQVIYGKPQENLAQAIQFIAEAARCGSHLILFPELWSTGYDLERRQEHSRTNQVILHQVAALAREHSIWIGGSYLLEKNGQFYNTLVLCSPQGGTNIRYEKIHLFRLMGEARHLSAGNKLIQAAMPWGKTALAICYDLRFPEMFRLLALQGAVISLLVAQWPRQRITHWLTLLKARAIENQGFMVGVNTVNATGSETFGGCSAIVDPWGREITKGSGQKAELLTAEIDLGQVTETRQSIPVFADRRPDVYALE